MPKSKRKKRPPKRVLALPDLEQTKSAVISGQRTYDHAITEFVDESRQARCLQGWGDVSRLTLYATAIGQERKVKLPS
jgi:hypothetical protein